MKIVDKMEFIYIYTIVGFLLCFIIFVGIGSYKIGSDIGFKSGYSSGKLAERMNRKRLEDMSKALNKEFNKAISKHEKDLS